MMLKLLLVVVFVWGAFRVNKRYMDNNNSSRVINSLSVGVSYLEPLQNFDPHSIHLAQEAEIALAVYSRLFNYDETGEIVGELAETAVWKELELHIKIKKGIKTQSGHEITEKDAYYTLKRIIEKSDLTHGNIKSLLCDRPDSCGALKVIEGKLIIVVSKEEYKSFLIPMLAAIDHSVIPIPALDLENLSSPIKHFSDTSGPYFVVSHNENEILLKANTENPKFSPEMAKKVTLVRGRKSEILEKYKIGIIDFICFTTGITNDDLEKIDSAKVVLRSEDIRLKFLAFTRRGMLDITKSRRIEIGKYIKKIFLEMIGGLSWKTTSVAFPKSSFGYIDEEEIELYFKKFEEYQNDIGIGPIEIVTSSDLVESLSFAVGEKSDISFKPLSSPPPWDKAVGDQSHGYLLHVDSVFQEDISLLYYGFAIDLFEDRENIPDWFSKYMKLGFEDRRKKLQELHQKMIKSGRLIPIGFSSYISVLKPQFYYENNAEFAGSEIWKIRRK